MQRKTIKDLNSAQQWQVNFDFFKHVNNLAFFITWLSDGAAHIFSNQWVKYLNAPIAMVTSVFSAIVAWRQVHLTKGQDKNLILNAVVQTLTGAAMLVAAIAVVASIAALSFVTPFLIAGAFALKTLFDFGSGIYFAAQAVAAGRRGDEHARAENKQKAKDAFLGAFLGGVMTGVTVTLMLVAAPVVQTVMASVAIAASAVGMIAMLFKANRLGRESRDIDETRNSDLADVREPLVVDAQPQHDLTQGAALARTLGVTAAAPRQIAQVEAMLAKPAVARNESTFENTEEVVASASFRA